MKIVKKEKNFPICFEDVGCGEIFECDDSYWMKIYNDLDNEYYAVCMSDGEICNEFKPSDMCYVVKTELHILD
jgi:uncharacterized protein YciU (UPF0263 family)